MLRLGTFVLIIPIAFFLIGCGSNSNPRTVSTAPGSPAPSPNPPGTGSMNPGSPSTAPDNYLAQIFVSVGKTPMTQGQITVDTNANNGAGNLQLTSVGANQSFVLQFCPYPQANTNCINVASVSTDMNGNADVNFTFPQKGAFSGTFQLANGDGSQFAASATGSSGTNFQSALLPAGTITGGISQTTGSAAGGGSVSVNGTTAHMILTGTTPNHTFNTAVCSVFLSTPCTSLANVTTDGQGNVSMDIGTVQSAGWSVFRVSDSNGVEFVSGFRVQ